MCEVFRGFQEACLPGGRVWDRCTHRGLLVGQDHLPLEFTQVAFGSRTHS